MNEYAFDSDGWSALMRAPWGKFNKESKEAKIEAIKKYDKDTELFWKRNSRGGIEPRI